MKMKVCQGLPNRGRGRWCFENAVLTGTSYPTALIRTGDQLIQPVNELTLSTGVSTTDVPFVENAPILRNYPGKVFFFLYNTDNYFHYLYDSLPILLEFLELRKTPEFAGLKLLMSPTIKYPFVHDCLGLLGITSEDIVIAHTQCSYDVMVVTNSYTHDGQSNDPPHPDIWKLYTQMKEAAFKTPIETPKKFYVSRRSRIHGDTSNMGTNYTTRRKMMVEDTLIERLQEKGYVEVFCEKLTMAEKVQYFANATHIVGAIGGGMCNLVFAQPECKVVSINSPEFDRINQRFLYTMKHTNLTQFRDTHPVNRKYVRVRVGTQIGEIVDEVDDKLQINIGNGVTWNESDPQCLKWVETNQVAFLDNGLNSPWSFDVVKCILSIQ